MDESPSGTKDAELLDARRKRAAANLSQSVAALEAIRLDLLRLHSDSTNLSPLTTLIDAAKVLGEDLNRLADAQREVDATVARPRRLGATRIPTPE